MDLKEAVNEYRKLMAELREDRCAVYFKSQISLQCRLHDCPCDLGAGSKEAIVVAVSAAVSTLSCAWQQCQPGSTCAMSDLLGGQEAAVDQMLNRISSMLSQYETQRDRDLTSRESLVGQREREVLERERAVQDRERRVREQEITLQQHAVGSARDGGRSSGKAPCSNCNRREPCSRPGECYDHHGYSAHNHNCRLCYDEWRDGTKGNRPGRR